MPSFLSLTAGINFLEVNLLSVSRDLSTQHIEVNCFTFRVKPYQVTWRIDSELITQVHAYLSMNGSELLNSVNQTYRQYISLEGSFSNCTNISCSTTVNEETSIEKYTLQGISHHIVSLNSNFYNALYCITFNNYFGFISTSDQFP